MQKRRVIVVMLCLLLCLSGLDLSMVADASDKNRAREQFIVMEEEDYDAAEHGKESNQEAEDESESLEELESEEELESLEELESGNADASEEAESETDEPLTEETTVLPEEELLLEEAAFFEQEQKVGQILIRMSAPAGVFPAGAVLQAKEVNGLEEEIVEAVEGVVSDRELAPVAVFDLTILDEEGNELQPDTEKGEVLVTFHHLDTQQAAQDADTEIQVFHVADDYQKADAVRTKVGKESVSFAATHFSKYAVMQMTKAGRSTGSFDLKSYLKKTELLFGNPPQPIPSDGKVSFGDSFSLRFYFYTLSADATDTIEEGKAYEIADLSSILNGGGLTTSPLPMNWKIMAKAADGKDYNLGTATLTNDHKLTFTFNLPDQVDNIKGQELLNIYMDCSCQLDQNSIGNKQDYEIDLSSVQGGKIKVYPTENAETSPTVKKSGVYNQGTGKITWTVTVNPGQNHTQGTAFWFVDALGSDERFDPATDVFMVGENDDKNNPNFQYNATDKVLRYKLDSYKDNQEIKISFTTTPTGLTAENKIATAAYQVTNKAQIKDEPENSILAETEPVVVNVPETKYLDKTVTGSTLAGDGQLILTWKVTIQTNGHSLKGVVLYDKIPDDFAYVAGSIKLNNAATKEPALQAGTNSGKSYNMKYEFGNTPIQSDQTITYQTKSSYRDIGTGQTYTDYYHGNYGAVKNEAWITIPEFDGIKPSDDQIGPVNSTGGGSAMLSKSGVYDPSLNQITWTITLNGNQKQALNDIKVTDTIPNTQTYVSGSLTINQQPHADSNLNNSQDADGPTIITIKNIPNAAADKQTVITLKTQIKEALHYTNKTQTHTNKAQLDCNEVKGLSVGASVSCKSTIIAKKQTAYDQNTHEITWEVTLNQNKASLTNAGFEDVLANGTSLVAGSVKINHVTATEGVAYTYDATANKLTVSVADVSDAAVGTEAAVMRVTYKTKVNMEDTGSFGTSFTDSQNKVTVQNKATFYRGNATERPFVTASFAVPNERLSKVGKYPAAADAPDQIAYTVHINKNQVTIPNGMHLTDTLSPGQTLSISSVMLQKATVSADGKLTAGDAVLPKKLTTVINQDGTTTMTLTLPDHSGQTAYILTYKTVLDMNIADHFSNSIELSGTAGGVNAVSNITREMIQNNGGGGQSVPKSKVELTLKNQADEPLANATFALLQKGPDGVYVECGARKTTDANGILTFLGLDVNGSYALMAISVPDGYQLSSALHYFTAPAKGSTHPVAITGEKASAVPADKPKKEHAGSSSDRTEQEDNIVDTAAPFVPNGWNNPMPNMVYLPNEPAPIYETTMAGQLALLMLQPDGEDKRLAEAQMRTRVQAILAVDPEFFSNSSIEIREYLTSLMSGPTAVLPKTGGFFGSGLMYLLGGVCVLAGLLIRIMDGRRGKQKR